MKKSKIWPFCEWFYDYLTLFKPRDIYVSQEIVKIR